MKIEKIKRARVRRKLHVRKKLLGTADRPRLSVFRSHRNISVQLIDDVAGLTLASASTRDKNLREQVSGGGNKKGADAVGEAIAKRALAVGIKSICFDRNRYKYHGRVKSLADAARKAGLVF